MKINFALFCQTRKPERNDQLGIQRFFIDFGKWLKEQNIEVDGKVDNHYFLVFEKKLFNDLLKICVGCLKDKVHL